MSSLPGEIKRPKFTKALKRLGFIIDKKGGDGSHYKIIWPKTQKSITIQSNLRKDVLRYLLKEIEECTGITWEDIKRVIKQCQSHDCQSHDCQSHDCQSHDLPNFYIFVKILKSIHK